MSTKFYIASRLENAETVRVLAKLLEERGWSLTYDWTKLGPVRDDRLPDVAKAEITGVEWADVLILLLPGGRGAHVELGIALARGKKVLITSPTTDPFTLTEATSAFYWAPNVRRLSHTCYSEIVEAALILAEHP
jgi:nucleoside 2-deoxyribosyltransferase